MTDRAVERRRFLRRLAGAAAAGAATFVGLQIWLTRPSPRAPLPPQAVRLGPPERFEEGLTLVSEHRIVVVRLFSKSFLGYTTYKMGFATREGLLAAILLLGLPFLLLAGLVRLLPPWPAGQLSRANGGADTR